MANILVVENDVSLTEMIREALARDGHEVDSEINGENALSMLERLDYDLIVLDAVLPGMSGLEMCRRYRSACGQARILMLKPIDAIEAEEGDYLDCGADSYMTQPLNFKELSARVRALMRRSINLLGDELAIGTLALNTRTHQVRRGNTYIDLVPQEFALLEFLMRHPNHVFSAKMLIDRVWHGQSSIESVRTHIKTLRRKIKSAGAGPYIRTVYGVGYALSMQEPKR